MAVAQGEVPPISGVAFRYTTFGGHPKVNSYAKGCTVYVYGLGWRRADNIRLGFWVKVCGPHGAKNCPEVLS